MNPTEDIYSDTIGPRNTTPTLRTIKLESPSPRSDSPVLFPGDGESWRRAMQKRQRQNGPSIPSSSRLLPLSQGPETTPAAEVEAQCPPAWLQLLRPPVRGGAGPPQEPQRTAREQRETHQRPSSLPAPSLQPWTPRALTQTSQPTVTVSDEVDSDDEPLLRRTSRAKRSMNAHDHGKASHNPSAASKRQRASDGTSQNSLSTSAQPTTRGTMPANIATQNGLQIVTVPPLPPSLTEIRCRGQMTFVLAMGFGGHGGNYIFQWPQGVGNPFFFVVCDKCTHSAKGRGYFWKHPFEGTAKAGLKHFGMHMSGLQILEHSGWYVTDAREHMEEMLNHNSALAKKEPPKMKLKAVRSAC